MTNPYFTPGSMKFLQKLASNNNRDWFQENKTDYETLVRAPALTFIEDMAGELAFLSPHFLAIAKKAGGSLMRVHRDVRFSKNKAPYKTNIGIQFRHEQGRDVHAPGFYVHIEPGESFIGAGLWRPDPCALGKIRDAIIQRDTSWVAAINDKNFKKIFEFSGESLKNAPRGYAKDHVLIDDVKRKDFIVISPVADEIVLKKNFKHHVMKKFSAADAYMQFLCQALGLRY